MDSPVTVLMMMWRQIRTASNQSVGFTLEEVQLLEKLRKKVGIIRENQHGTRTKRNP